MPPFIPQKRRASPSSPPKPASQKTSLFEAADRPRSSKTLRDHQSLLDHLNESEDESSLSDVSSAEFEDALPQPLPKRQKITYEDGKEDLEEEDEVDWEDAIDERPVSPKKSAEVSGDLDITLARSDRIGYLDTSRDKKKGPSKIERQIRISTHCMHVQFLLFHNLIRSGWATDEEVQKILVQQLPSNVRKEVERWRVRSGLVVPSVETVKSQLEPSNSTRKKTRQRGKQVRPQRDWGDSAARQEKGVPDMSHGDPLVRLMKVLTAYWRKRFTITAPGLRKQGYKALAALEEEVASFKSGPYNLEDHGERIDGIANFRKAAKACEGSRDLSVQLFTALTRGLGIDTRLVASLQPVGFGWSKHEDAPPVKSKNTDKPASDAGGLKGREPYEDQDTIATKSTSKRRRKTVAEHPRTGAEGTPAGRGNSDVPIYLSDTSDNVSAISIRSDDDNESLVDLTPSNPQKKPNKNYDRDLPAPTYWVEVISPVTHHVIPADPLCVPSAVAISPEDLAHFEPRGASAEKAKQVLAYVVAFSSDGTAKDVTTRYLKRHVWPGRTKGYRIPVEKMPVYNTRGKIKYYENYDWFKTAMNGYQRTGSMRDAVDELEDENDLKPTRPEKKEAEPGKDTLQSYKTSAEFVLERHLRREEAIRPGSNPVKSFTTGKGENAKEEPVFRRRDVEVCRTGESWHKEGRAVKAGEHPMKMVPIRAVTLNRKREVEEAERDGGEKPKQGMYARDQTDWIIPPPIKDGVIPKNAYGNIDCFVPTMVPKGAAHIPFRSTVKVCKRLEIDFAEAVTGFEFGKQMAVPVITGVVVAKEYEARVLKEWAKDEEERKIKEEGKREKLALGTWRKWLMGLRVIQRVRVEYGGMRDAHVREEMNPFTNQKRVQANQDHGSEQTLQNEDSDKGGNDRDVDLSVADEDTTIEGGGFLLEDEEEMDVKQTQNTTDFLVNDNKPSSLPLSPRTTSHTVSSYSHKDSAAGDTDDTDLSAVAEVSVISKNKRANLDKKSEIKSKRNPATNKRKASIPPSKAASQDRGVTTRQSVPKRKAARHSQNAIKSHYFNHSGSEDGSNSGSQSANSDVDSAVVETIATKGVRASKMKTKARNLRQRTRQ